MRWFLLLVPIAAVTACSSAPSGPPSVSTYSLQSKATDLFKGKIHQDPKSVSCDGELDAIVGATQKCTVVDLTGGKWALTAKVTGLTGDMADYDMTFDDKFATAEQVARSVGDLIGMGGLDGRAVKSSVCDGALPGTVGAEIRCTITFSDGTTLPATAKTVGIDNQGVKYDVYGDGKHWSRR
ncbi:DUF4333 domain-containing protein [Nocardia sp. R6R-6]|uniref:DUF4333 domain-containing protein n=1 Tax=Nocardia sp. R6R-6 TaxID=3459303 RepID=UPI00403DA906